MNCEVPRKAQKRQQPIGGTSNGKVSQRSWLSGGALKDERSFIRPGQWEEVEVNYSREGLCEFQVEGEGPGYSGMLSTSACICEACIWVWGNRASGKDQPKMKLDRKAKAKF